MARASEMTGLTRHVLKSLGALAEWQEKTGVDLIEKKGLEEAVAEDCKHSEGYK